jgi:hypothetical protein
MNITLSAHQANTGTGYTLTAPDSMQLYFGWNANLALQRVIRLQQLIPLTKSCDRIRRFKLNFNTTEPADFHARLKFVGMSLDRWGEYQCIFKCYINGIRSQLDVTLPEAFLMQYAGEIPHTIFLSFDAVKLMNQRKRTTPELFIEDCRDDLPEILQEMVA